MSEINICIKYSKDIKVKEIMDLKESKGYIRKTRGKNRKGEMVQLYFNFENFMKYLRLFMPMVFKRISNSL